MEGAKKQKADQKGVAKEQKSKKGSCGLFFWSVIKIFGFPEADSIGFCRPPEKQKKTKASMTQSAGDIKNFVKTLQANDLRVTSLYLSEL